jgi:deoxyribose-phosphate aldolase
MADQELVDKITREILNRLAGGGISSSGGGASSTTLAAGSRGAPSAAPGGAAGRPNGTNPADLAKYVDHTILKPEVTQDQIDKLIEEAIEYKFYSVCVNSSWVTYCAKKLRGTGVKIASVVGFPLGAMDARSKSFEARGAVENGASEIDMVINVGALKAGEHKVVEDDIRWVLRACRGTTVLKCIIETALLSDAEKVTACQIAKRAGAQFVKTSTGFSSNGATVEDVALMRKTVGPDMGVKASGGIRSYDDAITMIQAGATRLGTSSGIAIVTGAESKSNY